MAFIDAYPPARKRVSVEWKVRAKVSRFGSLSGTFAIVAGAAPATAHSGQRAVPRWRSS
ncbi:MAG: hypothetical protein H0W34_04035 [Pyrinomonadaceae bacterium]|nr:hypothetical protein [Pyrinomonadaceae bacterium]